MAILVVIGLVRQVLGTVSFVWVSCEDGFENLETGMEESSAAETRVGAKLLYHIPEYRLLGETS